MSNIYRLSRLRSVRLPINITEKCASVLKNSPSALSTSASLYGGIEEPVDVQRRYEILRPGEMAINSILRHSAEGFEIGDNITIGPTVLIHSGAGTYSWNVGSAQDINEASLMVFNMLVPLPELLVIGTGDTMIKLPHELRKKLVASGMKLEVLPTRNAVHTYNLLLQDGRNVSAALIPIRSNRSYNLAGRGDSDISSKAFNKDDLS